MAGLIDLGIIIGYAVFLFALTRTVMVIFDIQPAIINPYLGQLIGFVTLTIPVVLYSYFTEKSARKATIGKRIVKLKVIKENADSNRSILIRNILKYLPWEMAHTGVHWIVYYDNNHLPVSAWIWTLLIVPQILVLAYFLSIIFSKGRSSVYDCIARTKVLNMTVSSQHYMARFGNRK